MAKYGSLEALEEERNARLARKNARQQEKAAGETEAGAVPDSPPSATPLGIAGDGEPVTSTPEPGPRRSVEPWPPFLAERVRDSRTKRQPCLSQPSTSYGTASTSNRSQTGAHLADNPTLAAIPVEESSAYSLQDLLSFRVHAAVLLVPWKQCDDGHLTVLISSPHAGHVLYWMRTAVRAHENPALDVARHEATARSIPLLIAAFVLAGHTYPTQRRYKFWLEGLADTQAELRGQVREPHHFLRALSCSSHPFQLHIVSDVNDAICSAA